MKKTTKSTTASIKTPVSTASKSTQAPAKKSAPAKKKPATSSAPTATVISAQVDIGFGNILFLRGEGPGLSWDKGLAMDWTSNQTWAATLAGATAPVVFKVLVNDLTWNTGKDYVVEPGQSITVTPTF